MAPAWMGPRCALRLLALFLVVYLQTADCQIITLFPTIPTVSTTTPTTLRTYTTRKRERDDDMKGYHIALIVLAALTLAVLLSMCIASLFCKIRSQRCQDVGPRC